MWWRLRHRCWGFVKRMSTWISSDVSLFRYPDLERLEHDLENRLQKYRTILRISNKNDLKLGGNDKKVVNFNTSILLCIRAFILVGNIHWDCSKGAHYRHVEANSTSKPQPFSWSVRLLTLPHAGMEEGWQFEDGCSVRRPTTESRFEAT